MAKKGSTRKSAAPPIEGDSVETVGALQIDMHHVIFRCGDVVRGNSPAHIVDIDFPGPFQERGGVAVNDAGDFDNPPHFFDLYQRTLRLYPNGASWRDLRDGLRGWGLRAYTESRELLERNAPEELLSEERMIRVPDKDSADGYRYIRKMSWDDKVGRDGGGQLIETSTVLLCRLLDYVEEEEDNPDRLPDLGDELLGILHERNATSVDVNGGITGSVGAAAIEVLAKYLAEHGYPSVIVYGGFSHLESLQVAGVVREHIPIRVAAMQRMQPDMVLLLGQPKQTEEEISMFDVVSYASAFIRARHANAITVAGREQSSPVMIALHLAYDGTLVDRWLGVQITRAAGVKVEFAREVLERELKAGSIKYGRPDGMGRYPIQPVNRKLLKPRALVDLIPVLLFLRENNVVLHTTVMKPKWGRKVAQSVDIHLFGETMIDDLLERLEVDLIQLTTNGSRVVALSTFEQWLLDQYVDYSIEEIEETLSDPEHWTELCWLYGHALIGDRTTINTKLFTVGKCVCVIIGHPIVHEEDLAILVCRTVSNTVEDPFAPVREAREAARKAIEAEAVRKTKAEAKAKAVKAHKKGSKATTRATTRK